MKLQSWVIWTIVMAGCLAGCVTESSGGLPQPAAKAERVQAQLDLARGYMEKREWARARRPLEKALEIDPSHVESHVLRAVLFQAENEPQLAERHYRTALRVQPRNAQALNNYGSYLYAERRYDEAVSNFERLVQDTDYRGRPQAFENLGMAYLQTQRTDEAEHAFQRAIDLNPRLARATLELAELAYAKQNMGRAGELYRNFGKLARPTARSLCLGLKLAVWENDANQVASVSLALNNLFPEQAKSCRVTR